MRWFSIDDPLFATFPLWMRSFGISKEEGEIHLAAAIAGPEDDVLRLASQSGVAAATRHGHGYVPADWLAMRFPDVEAVCRKLVMVAEQVRPTDVQCVVRYLELAAAPGELDDGAISRTLDGENFARRQIAEATWLIPIALGRRLLAGSGMLVAGEYHVLSPDGQLLGGGPFPASDIYTAAYEVGPPALPDAVARKVAARSPEVMRYQEALANGGRPDELEAIPIIFFTERPTEAGLRRADELAQAYVDEDGT